MDKLIDRLEAAAERMHLRTVNNESTLLREAAAALRAVREAPVCEWRYDDSMGAWDSACGEAWQFTVDGPKENNVRFCHGCGQRVRLVRAPNDSEVVS